MTTRSRGPSVLVLATIVGCSQGSIDERQLRRESSAPPRPVIEAAPDTMHLENANQTVESATSTNSRVYDESADGHQQIADALTLAQEENKRVLLQFGAEWCGWCHRLHRLFETNNDIAAKLSADYVVVLIDVNGDHNQDVNEQYGNPTQFGLPVIVILDAKGNRLATKNTTELEEGDRHSPEKVMEFLEEWSPQT